MTTALEEEVRRAWRNRVLTICGRLARARNDIQALQETLQDSNVSFTDPLELLAACEASLLNSIKKGEA